MLAIFNSSSKCSNVTGHVDTFVVRYWTPAKYCRSNCVFRISCSFDLDVLLYENMSVSISTDM